VREFPVRYVGLMKPEIDLWNELALEALSNAHNQAHTMLPVKWGNELERNESSATMNVISRKPPTLSRYRGMPLKEEAMMVRALLSSCCHLEILKFTACCPPFSGHRFHSLLGSFYCKFTITAFICFFLLHLLRLLLCSGASPYLTLCHATYVEPNSAWRLTKVSSVLCYLFCG